MYNVDMNVVFRSMLRHWDQMFPVVQRQVFWDQASCVCVWHLETQLAHTDAEPKQYSLTPWDRQYLCPSADECQSDLKQDEGLPTSLFIMGRQRCGGDTRKVGEPFNVQLMSHLIIVTPRHTPKLFVMANCVSHLPTEALLLASPPPRCLMTHRRWWSSGWPGPSAEHRWPGCVWSTARID